MPIVLIGAANTCDAACTPQPITECMRSCGAGATSDHSSTPSPNRFRSFAIVRVRSLDHIAR
jgi:hypothetical protein